MRAYISPSLVISAIWFLGEQAQDRAQRVSDQFQRAAEGGWEATGRSISEVNEGFQALAAEMTEYSKKTFDDAIRTWEQLIGRVPQFREPLLWDREKKFLSFWMRRTG